MSTQCSCPEKLVFEAWCGGSKIMKINKSSPNLQELPTNQSVVSCMPARILPFSALTRLSRCLNVPGKQGICCKILWLALRISIWGIAYPFKSVPLSATRKLLRIALSILRWCMDELALSQYATEVPRESKWRRTLPGSSRSFLQCNPLI